MPLKLCTHGGCRQLVDHPGDGTSPRCSKHARKHSAENRGDYKHAQTERGGSIYHTSRWRKLRAAKLARNPLCEHCIQYGRSIPANTVDHIVEILDGGFIWDMNNLQSLCPTCHNRKTAAEKRKRNSHKQKEFPTLADF